MLHVDPSDGRSLLGYQDHFLRLVYDHWQHVIGGRREGGKRMNKGRDREEEMKRNEEE